MVDGIGELAAVRLSDTSAGIAGSEEPDSPIDELLLFVIMAFLKYYHYRRNVFLRLITSLTRGVAVESKSLSQQVSNQDLYPCSCDPFFLVWCGNDTLSPDGTIAVNIRPLPDQYVVLRGETRRTGGSI